MCRSFSEDDVSRVPGVQGGAAVLRGTRTPVGSVVALYRMYGESIDEVRAAYPHLSEQQIRAALAYYERHRAEVDADEERNGLEDILLSGVVCLLQ